jgi:hypothetical protein
MSTSLSEAAWLLTTGLLSAGQQHGSKHLMYLPGDRDTPRVSATSRRREVRTIDMTLNGRQHAQSHIGGIGRAAGQGSIGPA